MALTVVQAKKANLINDMLDAQAGNIFVIAEVLIENTERTELPYNPLYFGIKDADGFQYQASFAAPEPSLQSGTLAQGDKVRGWIAFEVKDGAKGLTLSYEPLVLLGGYKPIRIYLRRHLILAGIRSQGSL